MKISGAIFDLDGTLLDSMHIWRNIGSDYLESQGLVPEENLNDRIHTISLKQAAEYFIQNYGMTKSIDEVCNEVNAMVEVLYEKALAKSGIHKFLEHLYSKGVKMCVATATDRYLVEASLNKNGIRKYFSEIFTCTQVDAGKDKPTIYIKALEHLGTPKKETLVFEDAIYAIKTAKNAGFPIVGVYDIFSKDNQDEIKQISDIYVMDYLKATNEIF